MSLWLHVSLKFRETRQINVGETVQSKTVSPVVIGCTCVQCLPAVRTMAVSSTVSSWPCLPVTLHCHLCFVICLWSPCFLSSGVWINLFLFDVYYYFCLFFNLGFESFKPLQVTCSNQGAFKGTWGEFPVSFRWERKRLISE